MVVNVHERVHGLVHVPANISNLYNGIIFHAQMNVGFYGCPVHGAPSSADGLEGYSLLQCQEEYLFPVMNTTRMPLLCCLISG